MEAEEVQLLLKIRQGILDQSWEDIINAWNELSGEELELPDTRTPAEKLQEQIQEQLEDTKEEPKPAKKKRGRKKKAPSAVDPDTMEETIKDEDIVKIEGSDDDNKGRKKNSRGVKRRASGISEDMKANSEEGKNKPARFHDEIPEHIPRGSE